MSEMQEPVLECAASEAETRKQSSENLAQNETVPAVDFQAGDIRKTYKRARSIERFIASRQQAQSLLASPEVPN